MNLKLTLKPIFEKLKQLLNSEQYGAFSLNWFQRNRTVGQSPYVKPEDNIPYMDAKKNLLDQEIEEIDKASVATKKILDELPGSAPEAIRYLRNDVQDITQEKLAEITGIPLRTIQFYEAGTRKISEVNTVRLCLGLGLDPILREKFLNILEWHLGDSAERIKLKIILNDPFVDDRERIDGIIARLYPKK